MPRHRATLDELREFANAVREAGGGNPLDALMPSIPEDATACLIAKNLNFNCSVVTAEGYGIPATSDRWVMEVENKEIRDNIAAALGLAKRNRIEKGTYHYSTQTYSEPKPMYAVVLPLKIGQVAADFDEVSNTILTILDELDGFWFDRFDTWFSGDHDLDDPEQAKFFRKTVKRLLKQHTTKRERRNVAEMLPLVLDAEAEARAIASLVTPDGSIVV